MVLGLSNCDIRRTPPPVQQDFEEALWSDEPSGENAIPEGDQKRYAWQKPELVIRSLGDIEDKIIADIGAGTGYFTFRLVRSAKQVIAVDIDRDMIDLVELFRSNLDSTEQAKIVTRLATPEDPKLAKDEVDVAMIINTIGYIEDRPSYLDNLHNSLKPGGLLFIVDFKMKMIPDDIAPSADYRVSLLELEEDLQAAGYSAINTDDTSLDYQYIVKAYNIPSDKSSDD